MKIFLSGTGKMGQAVSAASLERGHQITSRYDDADVVIDFSHPSCLLPLAEKCVEFQVPLVVGTTGVEELLPQFRMIVEKGGIGAVYTPNFSLGMHLFTKLLTYACELIGPHGIYDVGAHEIHHKEKKDLPSGSANTLGSLIVDHMEGKTDLVFDLGNRKREDHEVHFSSSRVGFVNGTHTVQFDSSADSIILTHQARNRSGFALGALIAAEKIIEKEGVYTFEELLK